MNDSDKKIILKCLPQLAETVIFDVEFQDLLVTKTVFTSQMMTDIKCHPSPRLELLICLMRRGPNDFQNFRDALAETYQNRSLQILDDANRSLPNQSLVDLPQHYHNWRTSSPATMETYNPSSSISNEIPVSRSNSSAESIVLNPPNYEREVQTPEIEPMSDLPALPVDNTFTINVKSDKTDFKGVGVEGVYPCVLDGPRGLVLILNYKHFLKQKKREGSELDVRHLKELFEQLDYEVKTYSDLNYFDTLKAVEDFRNMEEHATADSTIVAIMSHGEDGSVAEGTRFLTSNGSSIGSEIIIDYFNNHDCPKLRGKPKLFLFQFCRGSKKDITPDSGIFTAQGMERKEGEDEKRRCTDILIVNSTLPGFESYRNTKHGTWLVMAICRVFMEHAWEFHLQKLFIKVDELLKLWSTENGNCKQTAESSLRAFNKKFFFNPGLVGGTT